MAIKLPNVDHYEILGLPSCEELKNLTIEGIKKAYKRKALELHPDKRPDDPHANAKFQKLQFSKDVLLDQFNRKKIDAKFSEQFKQSSARKPESEQTEQDWRDPDWDSDPGAEERRRNAWREFLKNHPYRKKKKKNSLLSLEFINQVLIWVSMALIMIVTRPNQIVEFQRSKYATIYGGICPSKKVEKNSMVGGIW
ncbi:hypothetical protein Cgig2_030383 [Carnegiea gigantea]|uniref:J domain-containing protein n=1 Tax=Carnegiea gigantea TaxID=171969 RepID=A0A9Q1KJL3_9CARY|nr:hypothetical protein Cgig2_030383 [Carnegiea gigantea]